MLANRIKAAKAVLEIARYIRLIGKRAKPSSPICVLHLIETGGPGGAERMLVSLVGHLDSDFQSTVGLARSGWLQSQIMLNGIASANIAADDIGDLGVIANLLRVVHEQKIDVIHAHEFYMSAMSGVVSKLTGIPLVITVHGKSYYPDKVRRVMLYRMAAKTAAAVVVVSRNLQSFFAQTIGINTSRVQVIYNGIKLEAPSRERQNLELFAEFGIPNTASIIGAVGNLYPVKGHIHLIRACRTIVERRPDAHVIILGRGALKESLMAEAKVLGIHDRVHLIGYRDDTSRWLAIMDVFVLPSLSEGLPLSLLEAMAAGIPSVATKVGGIPEVVSDGVTGLLVLPEDHQELAQKILLLLDNPTLASELGSAGRSHVHKEFSLERMTAEYGALYRKALGSCGKW